MIPTGRSNTRSIRRVPAARAISFSTFGPTPVSVRVSANRGKRIAGRIAGNLACGLEARAATRYIRPMSNAENGGSSETRRKQLFFRCQHRGFKELDLIFGAFAREHVRTLSEDELKQLDE